MRNRAIRAICDVRDRAGGCGDVATAALGDHWSTALVSQSQQRSTLLLCAALERTSASAKILSLTLSQYSNAAG